MARQSKKVKVIGRLDTSHIHKKTLSIDAFLMMVSLFILALFLFSSAKPEIVEVRREVPEINNNIVKEVGKEIVKEQVKFSKDRETLDNIFADGELSGEEEEFLVTLTCDDLKLIYETEKSLCLYLQDEEGNPLSLKSKKMGVGCRGVIVGGYQCGDYI